MPHKYRLRTKNKPELLFAMMRALAESDARISFEGRLGGSELLSLSGASFDESPVLRRNTLHPEMDFVVLPLTKSKIPEIETAIRSKLAFKGQDGIIHVQIEKAGLLAFAAYDEFHEECVIASDIPSELLDELVNQRVLRSYTTA